MEHEEEADRAEEEHEEEAPEERAPDLKVMPPSYVGLNDKTCLRHIGQMHGFLHEVRWCTCVCVAGGLGATHRSITHSTRYL